MTDPVKQQAWFDGWTPIIQALQPDVIEILNEAADLELSEGVTVTMQQYHDFATRSVDLYRSLCGNKPILLTSLPFYQMDKIAANPVQRNDLYYSFHFYFHSPSALANPRYVAMWNAYNPYVNPVAAKLATQECIMNSDWQVHTAIDAGLNLHFVFGVLNSVDETAGQAWLHDVYAICKQYDIESITQAQFDVPSAAAEYGMFMDMVGGLNAFGTVWSEEMPYIPIPPPPSPLPLIISAVLGVIGFVYLTR